jgi:hypothetical protein
MSVGVESLIEKTEYYNIMFSLLNTPLLRVGVRGLIEKC